MDPFWIIANSIATVVLAYILTKIFLKLVSPAPRPLASTERTFTDIHGKNRNFPSLFDRATVDISVVIPAYNEEQRLELMVLEAIEYLELQLEKAELIVVDDGSSDGTAKLAYSIASRHKNIEIRVLRLERNRGKGGAVVHGIMVSRGRYILFADADGATTFSDIAKLLTVCKSQDNCLALGSRAHMVNTDSVVKVHIFDLAFTYSQHLNERLSPNRVFLWDSINQGHPMRIQNVY